MRTILAALILAACTAPNDDRAVDAGEGDACVELASMLV